MFIEGRWVESWDQFRWSGVRRRESIQDGGILWWRRADAKVVQDPDQPFQPAIHGHDLANSRRSRSQISEMRKRVEQW